MIPTKTELRGNKEGKTVEKTDMEEGEKKQINYS